MSDIFDFLEHPGLGEENQADFHSPFEAAQNDDFSASHFGDEGHGFGEEHIDSFMDLEPTGDELHHINTFDMQNHYTEPHETHHTLGEELTCSDCSGSCAAYCASMDE